MRGGSSPFPVILSAPSGGGKTRIARELLARRSDVGYSVSCTTRPPRPGEEEGRDYFFLTHDEFVARVGRGEFAEWANVHGKLYGTLRGEVERVLGEGRHVLMDIDVQGAEQFTRAFPASVPVFILPPSAEVLVARLTQRRSEDAGSLARRLRSALAELQAVGRYHYVVVNDDLEQAIGSVSSIIDAESVRHERLNDLESQVGRLVDEMEKQLDRYPQS